MSKAYCAGEVRYQGESDDRHSAVRSGALCYRALRFTRRVASSAVVIFGLTLTLPAPATEEASMHLVASPNVELASLSKNDISAILLGSRRQWSDGSRILIAMLDSPAWQRPFLETLVDRSPPQYWAHWRNIVFSGRGIMPRIFDSEAALLSYLSERKGVIGQIHDVDLVEPGTAVLLPITEVVSR